jgi:YD repeat-containing protein
MIVKTLIEKEIKMNNNMIKIDISGYGGEFVLGTINKQQYDYWKAQSLDKLEDYAIDSFDYVNNDKINLPANMDFLEGGGWHDCDDVEHNYGCDLESAYMEITLPDGSSTVYDNIYDLRDTFMDDSSRTRLQYNPYENMIRETNSQTSLFKGHYFTAFSAEKGQFQYVEFENPRHFPFDISRLVFFTTNVNGEEVLESLAYIYPDDSSNEPTELSNEGGDTRGKSWECSIFTTFE